MADFSIETTGTCQNADVVVVGGGPSGLCAAVAAARQGVSVILIEQGNCCGGMATQGLVGPFMTSYDRDGEIMIIRGLFSEVVDRLVDRGAAIHPSKVRAGTCFTSWISAGHDHVTPFEPEGLKQVADEMLLEAGVHVLYHTSFLQPLMRGDTVTGVLVSSKKGVELIKAKVVIDCSGDADVAYRSGVFCETGDERLGIVQPATMFFHICNVEDDELEKEIRDNRDRFYRRDGINYRSFHWRVSEARKNGDWTLDRVSIGLYRMPGPGEWCVNTSRIMGVDSTDNESLSRGELTGRKQVEEIFRFLRKYIPGCKNARLKATGTYLGIRESRHIRGEYTMGLDDIVHASVPEDSIFVASNSVDIHGRFGPKSNEYLTVQDGKWYGVSYRCLLPMRVEQLLVAGRPVSASSEAAGAIRVMPTCMAMGQAAGTAAALAAGDGGTVRRVNIARLRGELIKNNVFLP